MTSAVVRQEADRKVQSPRASIAPTVPDGRWTRRALMMAMVFWMWLISNGFRMPTEEIKLSDEDGGGAIRQLVFMFAGAAGGWSLLVRGRLGPALARYRGLLLVALWILISMSYSAERILTFKRSILYMCGLFGVLGFLESSEDAEKSTIEFLAFTCGIVAWMSIAWMVVFPQNVWENPGRPGLAGVSNHPNTSGPFFAIGVVAGMGCDLRFPFGKLIKPMITLGCALALLLSDSVSSLGMCLAAVLVYMLRTGTPYRIMAGLSVAGVIYASIMAYGPGQVIVDVLGSMGRDTSMSGRDGLWKACFAEIPKHPWFGTGWGAFWTEGKGRELVYTWNPRQAHLAYLDVILNLGLVGALITLPPIILPVVRSFVIGDGDGKPLPNSVHALHAMCVPLLLIYAFQQSFFLKPDAFPFVLLMMTSGLMIKRQSIAAAAAPSRRQRARSAAAKVTPPELSGGQQPLPA